MTMTRDERWARREMYATPGAEAAYRALDPQSLPADERLAAQRAMVPLSLAEKKRSPASRAILDIRQAVTNTQRAVCAAGSRELTRWLFERSVDLEGAVSDGPPRPEVVEHLVCPLVDVASACQELGYPDCQAAEQLHALAVPACERARSAE